jgi:trimethylamine--corrinoid protein Co-methyltransferase
MRRGEKSVSIKDTGESWKSLMQLDWRIPVNMDNYIEPLKDDSIEAIHNNAMRILEEIGIKFLNREACSILEKAGCTVDHSSFNMRMDRHWVIHALTKFSITPMNEAKKL